MTKYILKYKVIAPGGEIVQERIITEGTMVQIQGKLDRMGITGVFGSKDVFDSRTDDSRNSMYTILFELTQLDEQGQKNIIGRKYSKPMTREESDGWLGRLGLGSLKEEDKEPEM